MVSLQNSRCRIILDGLTGSFDVLSRDEFLNPRDANLRDTFETVEANMNELRHTLQIQRLPSEGVMNAYQRLESSVQVMKKIIFQVSY